MSDQIGMADWHEKEEQLNTFYLLVCKIYPLLTKKKKKGQVFLSGTYL